MSFLRFFILFSVISIISYASFYFYESIDPRTVILVPKFILIMIFLYFITLIAYSVSWFGIQKGGESAATMILLGITIKLLFSMAFVLAYLLKINVKGIPFATQFFSLYFIFTAFEVYALLCNLRHRNKT